MKTKTIIASDRSHFAVVDEESGVMIRFSFARGHGGAYPDFVQEALDTQAALQRRDGDSDEVKAIAGWQAERNRVAALVEEHKARLLAKTAEIVNAARRNLA